MSKNILFLASDSVEEQELHRTLTDTQPGWQVLVTHTTEEAVSIAESKQLDVVVADFQLECKTGAALLNRVGERSPKALRFILAEADNREHVLRTVLGQHHFLAKPVLPDVFAEIIDKALALDATLPNDKLRSLAARIRAFPPMPSLYFQALKELKSDNCSAEIVGEIVARDLGMTARLLQVLNSGFYSLPRQITDPTEAVNLLGQDLVKSLLLSIHIFLKYDHIKPLYFSINQIWRHSNAVAHGARLITQLETDDAERAEDAFTAGLLHDIGKLVLSQNFEAQYNEVQRAAKTENRPLWELEQKTFGASHGEVGAFLLGRWGLPIGLIEATALHHQPHRSENREFSVLTAVHAPNALEQERNNPERKLVSATLNDSYLAELGLTDRVEVWRVVLKAGKLPDDRGSGYRGSNTEHARNLRTSSSVGSSDTNSGRSRGRFPRNQEVFATVAVVVAVTAAGWYSAHRWLNTGSVPVRASTIENPSGREGLGTGKVAPLTQSGDAATNSPGNVLPSPDAEPSSRIQPE